jgi:DNA-directed RNA polymerase subunit beta'
LSSHNILNPQNGTPITFLHRTWYWVFTILLKARNYRSEKVKGEGMSFYSMEEVMIAYNEGRQICMQHIKVSVRCVKKASMVKKLIETTVGRVMFNQIVPKEVGFINALLTKKTFVRSLVILSR